MVKLECSASLASMIRVGLVFLSIAIAVAIVVGASYGAQWLAPHLQGLSPSPWLWLLTVIPAALALVARRKRGRV
jgi:hypothetical protein